MIMLVMLYNHGCGSPGKPAGCTYTGTRYLLWGGEATVGKASDLTAPLLRSLEEGLMREAKRNAPTGRRVPYPVNPLAHRIALSQRPS